MAVKVGDFIRMLKGDGTYTFDGQTGRVTWIDDDYDVWAKMDANKTEYDYMSWCIGSVNTEGTHYVVTSSPDNKPV